LSSIPSPPEGSDGAIPTHWQEDLQKDANQAGPSTSSAATSPSERSKLLSGDKGFDAPRTMIAFACAHTCLARTEAGVCIVKKISVMLPQYQS